MLVVVDGDDVDGDGADGGGGSGTTGPDRHLARLLLGTMVLELGGRYGMSRNGKSPNGSPSPAEKTGDVGAMEEGALVVFVHRRDGSRRGD